MIFSNGKDCLFLALHLDILFVRERMDLEDGLGNYFLGKKNLTDLKHRKVVIYFSKLTSVESRQLSESRLSHAKSLGLIPSKEKRN